MILYVIYYISEVSYGCGPHVLLLTVKGHVYSWGSNGYGELGHGRTSVYEGTPKLIDDLQLSGVMITHIACGGFHSLALSNSGEVIIVKTCGLVFKYCIHVYSLNYVYYIFIIILSQICDYTVQVYSWGFNNCGQLGSANTISHYRPKKIAGELGRSI